MFLDDIRITGPDDEIHLKRLEQVLHRLGEANIKINETESEFLQNSIQYCEYRIDQSGTHKLREKVQAIDHMPRPESITELRSFLGMVNYYGRFIKKLSRILAPLHELLQKEIASNWTRKTEEAFQRAKEAFKGDTL